ncbi:LytR/AlgR family response regulator transcription factor [Christiangramia portivictoriae]|uniref:LytR/AlgR family response regulator transcription factor n=1 Tax=Christiangramia portivictoriae TaxID=326069 RepID=UPI0003F7C264|nr:LytTR family DNA-binding domain-containing protein [Christiangramia portivictoriae]
MPEKIRCLLVDDEPVALDILKNHILKIDFLEIVQSCRNATEAFNCISTTKIDLIFLDINMPGISGIAFAKAINKDIKVIFTTAYREFAIEGFNLHAADYLLKPISFERFLDAVLNFKNLYSKTTAADRAELATDFFFVKIDRKMHKIDFKNISWIESLSDYLKIETTEGTKVTRETISSIEEKLPDASFLRIHRSYIINISKIESYSHEEVIIGNKSLPVSRSYKEKASNVLKTFD